MKSTITLLAVVAMLPATAAAQVAVMPVQGTNLSPGETDAVGVLLAQQYTNISGKPVLGPAQTADALAAAGSSAAAAAQLGASEYIEATAVQLASKVTVRATLYAAGGATLFTAEMTARSLDDIEQVAERLAHALYDRVPIAETRNLHNVTETEGKVPNRVFVDKVMGLKLGFTMPFAKGLKLEPALSLQFDGRLEGEVYFLEFGVGGMLPSGATDGRSMGSLFAEFGASYYLMDEGVSPYVGAGVVPQILFTGFDVIVGLAPYAQIGVMLFRESSSRLYIELRAAQNVLPLRKTTKETNPVTYQETTVSEDKYFPTEVTLGIGIGW